MTAEKMKELLRNDPFVPIRLHMDDGRTIDVLYPDLTLLASQEMFVGFKDPGSTRRVARDGIYVSYSHIKQAALLSTSDAADASRS